MLSGSQVDCDARDFDVLLGQEYPHTPGIWRQRCIMQFHSHLPIGRPHANKTAKPENLARIGFSYVR